MQFEFKLLLLIFDLFDDCNELGEYIRDLVSLESGGSGGVVWRIRSSPTRLVSI